VDFHDHIRPLKVQQYFWMPAEDPVGKSMPEWKSRGGAVSVSAAHIAKLIDEKAGYALIDARRTVLAPAASDRCRCSPSTRDYFSRKVSSSFGFSPCRKLACTAVCVRRATPGN
jgi:hypothetical protein